MATKRPRFTLHRRNNRKPFTYLHRWTGVLAASMKWSLFFWLWELRCWHPEHREDVVMQYIKRSEDE